ncbi:mannose-6-phosphate isomerase, class I [Agilicoccus flavus]|uniref:mannose-6-phosphate isomerase, class I n=1 Tax=Agilicoccus flavus TaxID=2775968 RepID=UPI001CF66D89|nr:mannose-6-phosphate isomerase, class I [Agilicoccus flavus]
MDLLDAAVQPYAWGSHEVIARLQGRPAPTPEPEAELWMGAHPSAPSGLTRDGAATDLRRVVDADPEGELGADCARAHGGRLPFLLKVLAADQALSIQVHPDADRAAAGYAAERAGGLDAGASPTYADDWPKPEVLCALTEFEVLAGLRDPDDARALLDALDVPALAAVRAALTTGEGAGSRDVAMLAALRAVLTHPDPARLAADVVAACARLAQAPDGASAASTAHREAAEAVTCIARDHPDDIGLVAALLLRHRVLAPGEAIYMAAGGLHAYVRGAGIEILANSDNVLRAGLTGKKIDVEELLRIVDPGVGVPDLTPSDDGDGGQTYAAPVPHFRLHRVIRPAGAGPIPLPGRGPRIVLSVEGTATLTRPDGARLDVATGASAFVPAREDDVRLEPGGSGALDAFVACPGA